MLETYEISLEDFEGPLSLLLELIKKKQMDIYNLPISEITQDYLNKLDEMSKNQEITSDFLNVASILLQIKTKTILSKNEKEAANAKKELVQHLIDFQDYQDTQERLRSFIDIENKIFRRTKKQFITKEKRNHLNDLKNAFQELILKNKFEKETFDRFQRFTEQIGKFEFTIEEQMSFLRNIFISQKKVNFFDLFISIKKKEELIVNFGALLELIKLHEICLIYEDETIFLKKVEN